MWPCAWREGSNRATGPAQQASFMLLFIQNTKWLVVRGNHLAATVLLFGVKEVTIISTLGPWAHLDVWSPSYDLQNFTWDQH